jgi:hypothetical protein
VNKLVKVESGAKLVRIFCSLSTAWYFISGQVFRKRVAGDFPETTYIVFLSFQDTGKQYRQSQIQEMILL